MSFVFFMTSTMAFCFWLIQYLVYISYGDTISPSISNGTHEVYIVTEDTLFQFDDINCQLAHCIINCDVSSGCYGMNVNGYVSNELIIQCSQYQSCESMSVIGPALNAASLSISCTAQESCKVCYIVPMTDFSD